jgi:hypothetical protein
MSNDALQIRMANLGASFQRDGIVFLCHNSTDKPFIKQIADALELEFGRKFFLDVYAIPTGQAFVP